MSIDLEKDYDNDIPKHKKKSVSKGQPRADHKHKYETAAIRIDRVVLGKPQRIVCKGKVCIVCGRIGELKMFRVKNEESQQEIWDKYPHYYMNDLCDKVAVKAEFTCEPNVTYPNYSTK